VVIIKGRTT
uniref:Uncharacterized protein n=1 Tax=Solanum lycopersicum TaxID=4081 RepID=A0A3Q7GKR6_SOLLC